MTQMKVLFYDKSYCVTLKLFFLPHCRARQMCRVPPRGPLWLDLACGTSPPFLQQNWREIQKYNTPDVPDWMCRFLWKRQPLFTSEFWMSAAHLAESVIVMSDTSILRQFSTLPSVGLLTCVWQTRPDHSAVKSKKAKRVYETWKSSCTFIPDRDSVFLSLYFPSCWG